jgi:hypothetical protein
MAILKVIEVLSKTEKLGRYNKKGSETCSYKFEKHLFCLSVRSNHKR